MLLFEEIRREYEHGEKSIRGVARKLNIHRREGRAAITNAVPAKRKKVVRPCPALAPVREFIDAILRADKTLPRKHRHTARRIQRRLTEEKRLSIAASTVRRYVRRRKEEFGLAAREVFISQTYAPRQEALLEAHEEAFTFFGGVFGTLRGRILPKKQSDADPESRRPRGEKQSESGRRGARGGPSASTNSGAGW